MRARRRPIDRRLSRDVRATAAIEFAIVFPVVTLVLMGGLQLVFYINASRKVALIANSISEMISQAAPPTASSTTATVNSLDLHFSYDAALVLFPYLMTDAKRKNIAWWQNIIINYASIKFTQTSQNCPTSGDQSACYAAKVIWTSTGTSGGKYRPCSTPQTAADDGAAPSRLTLPRSVFGAGSIIAVDVSFTFVPTFGSQFLKSVQISKSVYLQPRYATLINYDTTNSDGIATLCS